MTTLKQYLDIRLLRSADTAVLITKVKLYQGASSYYITARWIKDRNGQSWD